MIDLHIHSTASDGSCTPFEIVEESLSIPGLTAIAITDHDTIEGVKQLIEAGIPQAIEFITGIEISALPLDDFSSSGSFHILGYGFSIHDQKLNESLKKLKQARAGRNPRILEKLNSLGCDLSLEEVKKICGPGQTGRPHIARAMVEKGFVTSFSDAFDKYLATGQPAYVDKFRLSCREAIELILDAGGIPVLAHPGLIKPTENNSLTKLINQLVEMGLKGIEVYHTDHTQEQTAFFANLAEKKEILATGGSDFHGTLKQGVKIGTGNGTLYVDSMHFSALIDEVEKQKTIYPGTENLEKNLGHIFTDKSLLNNALCHSSYANEHQNKKMNDNQRLEFLGDAVLGLVIGQMLMEKYPEINEGDLSKLRASLVSEAGLVSMAKKIDLGRFILLGKGERLTRGNEKDSILADTFEAVVAAVYLDNGFQKTYALIESHFNEKIEAAFKGSNIEDYKSMLQEYVQEMGKDAPCYTIVKESGPDHDKIFEITVNTCKTKTTGSGKSKKMAEQNAAKNALETLKNQAQKSK
ncbi:MAG: ribonuclease III [Thermodesulfobacteriota bacterium]|nr:ribonuclease III [Thermodesulfobacteriota bacterium]